MKAIDAVLQHVRDIGTRHVDVPEWVIDGQPLRIHYTPLSVKEREQISRKSATMGGDIDIEILMLKALDADGKPLFTLEDKPKLRMCASAVISRVAGEMIALPNVAELEKNSAAIPSE